MERFTEEAALLVAQTGPLNGQRWPIKETMIVGREPGCDIVVADRQVSRQHARFKLTPEGVTIEDLSSKNGTHVNGVSIDKPTLLRDGDTIQIAVTQKFLYLSSDATLPLEGDLPLQNETGQLSPVMSIQRLRLDKRSRRVWVANHAGIETEIVPPLSVSQFRLLEALYENQGRVITRPELARTVWGDDEAFDVSEQALDALVRRLRERINSIDPDHDYIVTVRGHGLRLDNPEL